MTASENVGRDLENFDFEKKVQEIYPAMSEGYDPVMAEAIKREDQVASDVILALCRVDVAHEWVNTLALQLTRAAWGQLGHEVPLEATNGELMVADPRRFLSIYSNYLKEAPETQVARDFFNQKEEELEAAFVLWEAKNSIRPHKTHLPQRLPQPTFMEAKAGAHALSDAPKMRNWISLEATDAWLHCPEGAKHQTRFSPNSLLLSWWGAPQSSRIDQIEEELQNLDFDAVVTYCVTLSGILSDPAARLTISLDNLIKLIGRDEDAKRTREARQEWRRKVWRWLLIFDSLAVVGARPGKNWKEPKVSGEARKRMPAQKLYSRDPLIRIMGTFTTEAGTFDDRKPPVEVTISAGEWLMQFHKNREMLSDFGDVLNIAKIPRGKPSGSWAVCAGLMLQQLWREESSRAELHLVSRGKTDEPKRETLRFRHFTRRELLTKMLRSDHDVNELLSKDNARTRVPTYWKQAIKWLQDSNVIGSYREVEAEDRPNWKSRSCLNWRDAWLDQPLDIRPTDSILNDAIAINKAATKARRRGRVGLAKAQVSHTKLAGTGAKL